MIKTILIPTDFSVASLNLVKNVLDERSGECLNFLLTHGISLSDSITDLLFFSRTDILQSLTNDDFQSSCELLKSRYGKRINSLRLDIFTGYRQSSFNTMLEVANVDEIIYYENYKLENPSRKSFDLHPYILKSKVAKTAVQRSVVDYKIRENEPLAELFFATKQVRS